MSESWWNYVERVTGRAQQKEIAETTGIEQSSISRWKQGKNTPKAEAVVAFARSYHRPPVEALIAAGYLKTGEVGDVVEIVQSLDDMPNEELLRLQTDLIAVIQRRLRNGSRPDPDAPML